jgi:hypothetical protein
MILRMKTLLKSHHKAVKNEIVGESEGGNDGTDVLLP